jgi:hypothetical protein
MWVKADAAGGEAYRGVAGEWRPPLLISRGYWNSDGVLFDNQVGGSGDQRVTRATRRSMSARAFSGLNAVRSPTSGAKAAVSENVRVRQCPTGENALSPKRWPAMELRHGEQKRADISSDE